MGKEELIDLLDQVEEPEMDRNTTAEEDQSGAYIPKVIGRAFVEKTRMSDPSKPGTTHSMKRQ